MVSWNTVKTDPLDAPRIRILFFCLNVVWRKD
nr:MAG TPA: hypothetical protein [Caudoviricetes sp.]